GRFLHARQILVSDHAGLELRLVEGGNPEDGTGNSSGDFPPEEFLPEIVGAWQSDAHDGVPGFFEGRNGCILSLVWLRRESHISEDPIAAIASRSGEAFAIHRNNAFADFSIGFGN